MRIAAHLGVKDEVELIEAAIAHLRAIGVDHIIACDMNSTDGTSEILERYRSDDDFWTLRLSDSEPDDFRGWAAQGAEAIRRAKADWVIFLDADEFWLPASGNLKGMALNGIDLLSVDRFNVPLGAGGPMMPLPPAPDRYDDVLLLVQAIPDFRDYLAAHAETPWIMAVPMPKVMARRDRIADLTVGTHDIVPTDGAPLRRAKPADLVIAHLPFTTRSRFKRKVDNVRRVFAVHDKFFGQSMAWHWRRWATLAEKGDLDGEFDRTIFSRAAIADLRARGVIRSAAEHFAGWAAASAPAVV